MTTLQPLSSAYSTLRRSTDAGKPSHLEWLPVRALVVNTAYQRPITKTGEATIERIMASFAWSRFSPLIVRRVPGAVELYEIIDGQHRATAALCCGYDCVPAMIVRASDVEAAQIFAGVNGTVTPMQPLSVYKAAIAGGEQWAVECRDAAAAAGCEILRYPVPRLKQKPLQTMSIQAIRRAWQQHGPVVLAATFRLLAAGRQSTELGYLTSRLIQNYNRILASRPGWVTNIEAACSAVRAMSLNLMLEESTVAEKKIAARIGDGRRGDAEDDVRARVAEALSRKLTRQMIAASLRLPYAEVDRLVSEIHRSTTTLLGKG